MNPKIILRTAAPAAVSLLISLTAAGRPARAVTVDPACKPGLDAILKQIGTPTHIYATEVPAHGGKKPEVRETIYAGGAIYIQIKGQWKRSPISTQDMRKQEEENVRNAKSMSCRYLRDEAVNGESAAVYRAQDVTDVGSSDVTLWVSKRTGLPLRGENDLDTGGGDKMHLSIRYDYAGVKAPAGVK
ncbi:MAG TPA: hypothetical protein VGG20_24700 [Thermoanaerobaculia bacterium]|jgi:hypothetical protein